MIFHTIAIKEVSKKNYNVNVLIQAESVEFIKSLLQSYNLAILEISEYKWEVDTFGTAEITINHKNKDVVMTSNLNNLRTLVHDFLIIGFDVKSVNFVDYRKLSWQEVSTIIQQAKDDVALDKKLEKESTDIENETIFLHDIKLEKAISVANDVLQDIQQNIYPNEDIISKDKIRDIKLIEQDLIKLKMWSNAEKIIDVLEKLINKVSDAKWEVLSKQDKSLILLDSANTDVDIQQELNLLDKAKKLNEIWETRTINDYFYKITWAFGIQIKCLWNDIVNKIRNSSEFLSNIFNIINIFIFMMLILSWLTLWLSNFWWENVTDPYYYIVIIFFWVFGLVAYVLNFFNEKNSRKSLILIWIWLIISIVLYLFFKYNFVF